MNCERLGFTTKSPATRIEQGFSALASFSQEQRMTATAARQVYSMRCYQDGVFMKTKPNRATESSPRQVFANGEIRMSPTAQGTAVTKSSAQLAHEDAKRALHALAARQGAPAYGRKRAYFELHNIDSDIATILLLGGPYRGKRIREDMDARGLYTVNGQHGEFVYKLLHRHEQGAIAVPFDASELEIRRHMFMFDLPVAELPQPVSLPTAPARTHARLSARITSGQEHAFAQY